MDYEKAYKEALERARELHNQLIKEGTLATPKGIESIFSELRESEDEKIKKEIVVYLESQGASIKYDFTKWIAWLEKQGGKSDKVEPKFKVGDWIVKQYLSYPFVIVDIKNDSYILNDIEGNKYEETIDFANSVFHLWTIQDAKDGDVLYSPCCKLLWIYKDDKSCYVGNNLNYCSNYVVINEHILIPTDAIPATKEQRDLLFQKMKEAGYEWDSEKKELKKLEQSCYHNDGLYYAIDILEKTFGKVEGYQSDDGKMEHQAAIETVNALYHGKNLKTLNHFTTT